MNGSYGRCDGRRYDGSEHSGKDSEKNSRYV